LEHPCETNTDSLRLRWTNITSGQGGAISNIQAKVSKISYFEETLPDYCNSSLFPDRLFQDVNVAIKGDWYEQVVDLKNDTKLQITWIMYFNRIHSELLWHF